MVSDEIRNISVSALIFVQLSSNMPNISKYLIRAFLWFQFAKTDKSKIYQWAGYETDKERTDANGLTNVLLVRRALSDNLNVTIA